MFLAAGLMFKLETKAAVEFTGQVSLGYQSFYKAVEPKPAEFQNSAGKLELNPSFQWSNPRARIKIKALLGYDNTFSEKKDKTFIIPEEFFWERRRGRNSWIIGINTFNWGITDVINPLDVINTRNFRNLLTPYKIGAPSLVWGHSRDFWSFEFVFIPRQIPSVLPPNGSRFYPRGRSLEIFAEQAQPDGYTVRVPSEAVRYKIQKAEEYNDPFANNAGLKLRFTGNRLETHLIGFEGHPGFPNYKPPPDVTAIDLSDPQNLIFELNPDLIIVPQYQRIRMAGLGWIYTRDTFIAKLAHAQVWQTKENVFTAQPKTTVLAFEKPFALGSLENTFVLQGALQSDPNQKKESTISTRAIYDKSVMVGLRTAASIDWSTTFGLLSNPELKVQILSFDSSYRWNDRVHLQLTAQHLSGAKGTLIDSISGASNGNLNIISTW